MNKRFWIVCAALAAISAGQALAADVIKTTRTGPSISGKVLEVSPVKLSVEVKGVAMDIPVNEIVSVAYEGEPDQLRTARPTLLARRYPEALEQLNKIEIDADARKEITQDVLYYKALCMAKMAMGGDGDILAAGKAMNGFLTAHPASYHYFDACEIIGDLLLASRKFPQAAAFYAKVAAAPWPDFKMRAGIASARALFAENKTADALKAYDDVLAVEAKGAAADNYRTLATLGKARCQIAAGKAVEAAKTAEDIIAKIDPEQTEIQAQAHNVLGTALRAQKKTKDALLAFLHTELLYGGSSDDSQAEAQASLVVLWGELSQPDRAKRAKELLVERYHNTPWGQ